VGIRGIALHRSRGAHEAGVEDPAHGALEHLVAPSLGLECSFARGFSRRQQRGLCLDLVQPAHDRA
jgi:hypothetical protein